MKKKTLNPTAGILATNAANFRYEKGWSQARAAAQAGISERAYAALEACENSPKFSTVQKVAKAYGVTSSELAGETPCVGKIQSSLDDLNQRMDELTRYLQRFVPKVA